MGNWGSKLPCPILQRARTVKYGIKDGITAEAWLQAPAIHLIRQGLLLQLSFPTVQRIEIRGML
jgi:hypothetical protein